MAEKTITLNTQVFSWGFFDIVGASVMNLVEDLEEMFWS